MQEWEALTGVMIGRRDPGHWDQPPEPVSFLDLKGIVEAMLAEIILDKVTFFCYNIERGTADSMEVRCADRPLGTLIQINPAVTRSFDLEAPVFAFEFNLAELQIAASQRRVYQAFPKFPPLQRDLAFILAEDVPAGEVLGSLRQTGGAVLTGCELFDVYRGAQIGEGFKSLAFRLNFQSPERTLTDAEAETAISGLIRVMQEKYNAKLRA
jgi:phenylalanyl-tRNA synthetase beta chain